MENKLFIPVSKETREESEKRVNNMLSSKELLNSFLEDNKKLNHEVINVVRLENNEDLLNLVLNKDTDKVAEYIIENVTILKKIVMNSSDTNDGPVMKPQGFTTIAVVPAVVLVTAEFGLAVQAGVIADIYVAINQKFYGVTSNNLAFFALCRIPEVKCMFQAISYMSSESFSKQVASVLVKKLSDEKSLNRVIGVCEC